MLPLAGHSGWNEGIMRKLATAVAVAFAALSAHAALACEDKVETAEQPRQKPAVAEKTKKQSKQQQKAKKTDASDKTTVARADKG
jgi:anti-sigma-K factor RskA